VLIKFLFGSKKIDLREESEGIKNRPDVSSERRREKGKINESVWGREGGTLPEGRKKENNK